jgi:hypothetical protein
LRFKRFSCIPSEHHWVLRCQCQKTSAHNESSQFILASFAGSFCGF